LVSSDDNFCLPHHSFVQQHASGFTKLYTLEQSGSFKIDQ